MGIPFKILNPKLQKTSFNIVFLAIFPRYRLLDKVPPNKGHDKYFAVLVLGHLVSISRCRCSGKTARNTF